MATLSGAWAAHRKKYSNYNKGLADYGYTQWRVGGTQKEIPIPLEVRPMPGPSTL